MAPDGQRRRAGHAGDRSGATLHASIDVGQRRPVLRDVSHKSSLTATRAYSASQSLTLLSTLLSLFFSLSLFLSLSRFLSLALVMTVGRTFLFVSNLNQMEEGPGSAL